MIANKDQYSLVYQNPSTNGFVYLHPNQNKTEQFINVSTGISLARKGFKIWLIPPVDLPGQRTPDAWLETENIFVEFKLCQTPTASAIDKAIQKAKKQAAYILLVIDCDISNDELIYGVENRVQREENGHPIAGIWILRSGSLCQFIKAEILDKSWRERL